MSGMSDLDLSIRELIFEGKLEENIKENVGTKIKIRDYVHVVSEKEIRNYYGDKKGKYYYMPITVRFSKEITELQKILDKKGKN